MYSNTPTYIEDDIVVNLIYIYKKKLNLLYVHISI